MTTKWVISPDFPTGKAVELTTEEQSTLDTAKAEFEAEVAEKGTPEERKIARVTKEAEDKISANNKLKALGLTDDEIIAFKQ